MRIQDVYIRKIVSVYFSCMRVRIHPHATKHGLSEKQIREAYDTLISPKRVRGRDVNTDPQRYAAVGLDASGMPIELVFVELSDDTILIFHANRLTKQFSKEVLN